MEVETRTTKLCVPEVKSHGRHFSMRRLLLTSNRNLFPKYIWCTLFTALGGFIWGFDTGSIGPITVMPQFRGHFGDSSPSVQGWIVSSILVTASLASIIAGPLSDRFSRTYTIAFGGLVSAVGSSVACSAKTLPQLFVGRCIAGIGEGLFISTITVYVTEIAPASVRGRLATTVQLFNTIGITAGYFTCFGTVKIPGSLSWRLPLGLEAAVGIILAIGTPFFPHSPRWLTYVGRHTEAEVASVKLGIEVIKAKKEEPEQESRTGSSVTIQSRDGTNFWKVTKGLFASDVRFRTVFGVFLMAMQQASGIDGVLYYAPVLFAQAGLSSSTASFLASGVSGIVIVIFTIITQGFQDKWSRRTQTIGGGAVVAISMLTIGAIYATHGNDSKAGRWTIIVLIYVFVVGFVMSWAIVCRIICSEIQPIRTRAAATSLGQCANWVVNWIIAFSTPLFLARSSSGPYFLFGGCSMFTVLVCFAFQPETKGLNLETMDKGLNNGPWKVAFKKRPDLRNRSAQNSLQWV